MNRAPYVIIGNSAAAVGAVAGIRGAGAASPITVIAMEPHHTYSRPLISYLLSGVVDEERMGYRPLDFYEKNNVRPMLGVEVTGIDAEARAVRTGDGRRLAFEKLLIAVGGRPIVPADVQGTDAEGVFTFTTWDDARRIRAQVDAGGRRAVVVGGGLIGLKCMEALVKLGVTTTIVELADRILSVTFDRTASAIARRHLEARGVRIMCGTTVARVEAPNGIVTGVALRDGTQVPCDLVVFAIGVRPNVEIVRGTPIEAESGIIVDERMETSVPGIYAAGDVAQVTDLLTGASRPIPILPNAYRQGLVAGSNMAGKRRIYRGAIAMNSVDFLGLPTISVGVTAPEGDGCETLSALDEAKPSYRKLVVRDGRVIGAIFVGDIDRAGIITGLIKEGINVEGLQQALLTEQIGLISLPAEYRKHVVSGLGIEV